MATIMATIMAIGNVDMAAAGTGWCRQSLAGQLFTAQHAQQRRLLYSNNRLLYNHKIKTVLLGQKRNMPTALLLELEPEPNDSKFITK
jgi:hypothetical protein